MERFDLLQIATPHKSSLEALFASRNGIYGPDAVIPVFAGGYKVLLADGLFWQNVVDKFFFHLVKMEYQIFLLGDCQFYLTQEIFLYDQPKTVHCCHEFGLECDVQ